MRISRMILGWSGFARNTGNGCPLYDQRRLDTCHTWPSCTPRSLRRYILAANGLSLRVLLASRCLGRGL